ncbi:HAMP domain-containing histidine kinase [Chitinophagaceae bacterium LB-8]|uniref:histidine kinase n=1 Tax=Paraflavisolibacter caeni TaxID=2982496 RepID=A0A9X3B6A3_9BACT|nr:HAMP domain-containing sensor histidine kinase [Paraflavisolibacter caeni]MCU7547715.1 HAMP domain-containing histidine kinase [Paraflavisolibacter caeni]
MILRSQTIRLTIFISTLVIAAIIIFQLIWLKKVYNFEQKEFDHSIAKAVRNFYDDINSDIDPATLLSDLIWRKNSQTYFVRITEPVNNDSLAYYMHAELEDENIFTDCFMGVYSSRLRRYVFQAFLPSATSKNAYKVELPLSNETYPHITLFFPHRQQYILSLMNFWLITSALLLVVLILFGGSLYYFYQQKFLNETQKDFINNFTHEFKTPVSVINLAAETLENPEIGNRPERLLKYAGIVKYQGKYLQDQIERLLHYAYAESNHLKLNKAEVFLHPVIEKSLDNLGPLISDKKATIELHLDAVNDKVLSDRGYLLIVVTNLIENALKYAEHPKLIISTNNENKTFVLSIKDNGKGIEHKHLHKIFKKFYRVTNGEQSPGRGFGLGLPFVKRIIDAHGGKISVESIPEVGSNFIIKLPNGIGFRK